MRRTTLQPTLAGRPGADHDEDFRRLEGRTAAGPETGHRGFHSRCSAANFSRPASCRSTRRTARRSFGRARAVRLRLREKHLKRSRRGTGERPTCRWTTCRTRQRKAFAAYVFLATLQELIVQHLDPTAMESGTQSSVGRTPRRHASRVRAPRPQENRTTASRVSGAAEIVQVNFRNRVLTLTAGRPVAFIPDTLQCSSAFNNCSLPLL